MKRLALLALLIGLCVSASAQIKISALPNATTPLAGTEVLPCNQTGVTSQCTSAAISQTIAGGVTTANQVIATPAGVAGAVSLRALVSGDINTALVGSLASPPAIGGTTPAAGSFTTLAASSTVSGSGFSTYLASPPAIGGTTPAAGAFTTLSATSTVSGAGITSLFASPPAIGGTAAAAGTFTALTANGAVNLNASNNAATNLGTGTTTSAVGIGGTANATNIGSPLNLTTAGGISHASWTTTGLAISGTAQILTDTTVSGTIPREAAAALPVWTVASTNASVTISNLDTLYIPTPVGGTNVTVTNLWSLETAGGAQIAGVLNGLAGANISGNNVSLNNSSNFLTNLNTGTSTAGVNIGSGTGNNTVTIGNGTGKTLIKDPLVSAAGTQFTVASGTGACATSSTLNGGVQAGDLTCTGATGASTVTLTLVATTTAYTCWGRDITTPTTVTQTGAKSTTSVTLTFTSVTLNDVVQFGCLGY